MARKEKKYHFIYKTTNLLNGKYYIGMHSTDNLDDGYLGSGVRLRYSVNKYGRENHLREILEFVNNRIDLRKREEEIVNLNEIAKKECMNLRVGGEWGSIDIRYEKQSSWLKSKWNEKEYRDKITRLSRERMRQHHKNGKIKYDTFTGMIHSNETKKKMSDAKIGTGTGENNSQFGTCWITKDGINKKIKKEELEGFLSSGWIKGRKMN